MPRKSRKRKRGILWKLLISAVLILIVAAALFLGSIRLGLFGALPGKEELKKLESYTAARILASDGELLGLYYVQNRTHTDLSTLPGYLVNALIATEDARFYSHHGIDFRSIVRVIVKSLLLGDRSSGGGSTISQQLAKNLFPRKDFGLLTIPVAKVREMIIARRLEMIYSKSELLELYLNTVTFGENTYGIETASLTFFSKNPASLSMEESALLIGSLKASATYNPRLNPEAARQRRDVVLRQMYRYDYLDERQFDSLQKLPVKLSYMKLDHVSGPAPYFREYIRREIGEILEELSKKTGVQYNLYTDGLTIQTTLNLDLQRHAEKSVQEHFSILQQAFRENWDGNEPWRRDITMATLQIKQSFAYQSLVKAGLDHQQAVQAMKVPRPSRVFTWQGVRDTLISPLDSVLYHFEMLQCGLVAIDPGTGALLAWVGGDDYGFFKYDHVTASRQTGSTFKPIVYAASLEQGTDPCQLYAAEAETYDEYESWTPRNYDNNYEGYFSLQGALVNSVNTVSVKILMETGIKEVSDLAGHLGITTALPQSPSLALGSADVSLLEMTAAYAAFLNKGVPVMPYAIERITDRNGRVIYQALPVTDGEPVMSPSTAETVTGMLEAVVERGTASSLHNRWELNNALAGKTGTTQAQADGWFIGMTPSIVMGVWTGGDSPEMRFRSGSLGSGAQSALPVFARVIRKMNSDKALRQYVDGDF
ncbi:MAG: penicillin-binding protein, partial [Bacteroidales bacterium]|nr:penicillin-binding protein [Bacteroidales bacterium]